MKVLPFNKEGLGTELQKRIHVAVDAAPIPQQLKARIKNCRGCGRRVAALDRRFPGSGG